MFEGVHRQNVGVIQFGNGPRLTLETGGTVRVIMHPRRQSLHSHITIQIRLVSLIDRAHRTSADPFQQLITPHGLPYQAGFRSLLGHCLFK